MSGYTGDADVMHLMDDLEPIAAEEELHALTCAACHVPHKDEGRWVSFLVNDNDLAEGNWDPNANGVPDQFDFCTSCHTYYNQDGVLIGSGSTASGTAPHYHNTAWYRILPSTHYDDPATGAEMDVSTVEGYNIRQTINGEVNENPCFDCHGHEFRTNTRRSRDIPEADDYAPDYGYTIHTQWASSGHAGGLLKAKYAADSGSRSEENVDNVMMAGASDETSGGGFTHYNWDRSGRQSCQMCHTATGFANYVSDPEGYDPLNNDFSHLVGWDGNADEDGSPQNELLYCWGCHENAATGVLRVTGAVTAVYTYNDQPIVFPDVGASNTCVVCHSGRGNNEEASTSSRFAGHHAPAAADLFSEYSHVAYEYPGLDYSNPLREDGSPFFAHDTIGVDSGQGPCVSCHMANNANHTFAVVEKDENGLITDVLNKSLCDTCHTPGASYEITSAKLEEESEGYQNAGALIQDLINQENSLSNYTGAVINNGNELENDRGAFQNAKLPSDEPGGFAHNRYYVKRAIFDAIDWVDNGVLDGTIADYSATYPEGAHWLGTTRP
ncbi:MAG: hypothetical protein C0614_09110 [Desulfuromonas sp.]|nr:MAG: hypothetical protein C0614_09110 [Desulfuromonas sp.]